MSPIGDGKYSSLCEVKHKGGKRVVNTIELKKALLDAGITQQRLAEMSGISKNALNRKINNNSDFTLSETTVVCECLGITDPVRKCTIFLA